MRQKACWLVLVALFGVASASQNPGAVFLMIWPAARPTALGGAFTAIADDASSVYYNQGGMAFLEKTHATLMHCNWLPGLYQGMYYEYAGLTHQLPGYGSVGANIVYLTTGETDVVNERGDFLGRYTTFDVAVAGGYGYPVLPNLGVGVAAKFIYSFLVPEWVWKVMPELGIEAGGTGITWALDAGVLYKPFSFLHAGLALSNIGPNIAYTSSGESDPLPRMLRLGVAYYPVQNNVVSVGITPEITKILVGMFYDSTGTKPFSRKLQEEMRDAWKSVGVEAKFINLLSTRVGYFEDLTGQRGGVVLEKEGQTYHYGLGDVLTRKDLGKFKSMGLCFGAGLEFARFQFDLSMDQLIYDFPTSNYKFSFSYQF
ncbi:MAG: PorV/PorQ family protein [candidate division WOR-3 bacterium]|nr:PorV/PorQ family protein [candidate division WOR-3 bacterium]